jgi:hypothetical protein
MNPIQRIGAITLWQTVKFLAIAAVAVVLLLAVGLFALAVWPNRQAPLNEPVDKIVYLNQGWGPNRESAARQLYYYTPQGTSIKGLRYSWLLHLERPFSSARFFEPAHMQSYGFLVDTAPTPANPARLPVGFARRFDSELQDEVLDLTCAACHTGQLATMRNGKRIGIRVDGGQAMHAFTDMKPGDFLPDLILSMTTTYVNPLKFNRFARNVLGDRYAEGKGALRNSFYGVLKTFARQGWNDMSRKLYPVAEGYGRTDAIGRIANTVFGDHISPANYRPGDAPVSYPPVWDIWKFDWVQYGASVRHPLARNVGEGMGVGTSYRLVDDYGRPIPAAERYQASTMVENLFQIEKTLWWLTPPKWPDELLGKVDCRRAIYGKALFKTYCLRCHGPRLASPATIAIDAPCKSRDTHWIMTILNAADIGTDSRAADNFAHNTLDLTPTGLTAADVRGLLLPLLREDLNRRLSTLKPGSDQWKQVQSAGEMEIQKKLADTDMRAVPIGFGLNYFGILIRELYRKDPRYVAPASYPPDRGPDDGYFGEIDMPEAPPAYKARPLAGIWATPPFLHNGSVPSLYEMLLPADKRTRTFPMGTKEFDPVRVGYMLKDVSGKSFVFDTSLAGNRNTGHEFKGSGGPVAPVATGQACIAGADALPAVLEEQGWSSEAPKNGVVGPELTDDQRWAIVEYLKVHRNDPAADEFPDYCHCAGSPAPPQPAVKIPSCPPASAAPKMVASMAGKQ